MLTRILLKHVLVMAAFMVPAAAIAAGLIIDGRVTVGVLMGGFLAVLSGGGLIFLVGKLLDPEEKGSTKATFAVLLALKFVVVAGLLWASLAAWGFSGLGIVGGMGVGLLAVVLGANRGSASPDGQRAMAQAEKQIEKEMEDKPDDVR